MSARPHLYHGGVAGLGPGDVIRPGQAHRKHIDGCPVCAAHARGQTTAIDPNHGGLFTHEAALSFEDDDEQERRTATRRRRKR
jgi:hypothetical protein